MKYSQEEYQKQLEALNNAKLAEEYKKMRDFLSQGHRYGLWETSEKDLMDMIRDIEQEMKKRRDSEKK